MQHIEHTDGRRLVLHPRDWCPWRSIALGLAVIVGFLLVAAPELRMPIVGLLGLVVGVPLLIEYVSWRSGHTVEQAQPD